jgi:hypothetical protein
MNRYVIEREIPGVGSLNAEQRCAAARTSNQALAQLSPTIRWEHSYVTAEKLFCVYLADDEAAIRRHAELGGFPANTITIVTSIITPATGH